MEPLPTMTWRAALALWLVATVVTIPFAWLLPGLPGMGPAGPAAPEVLGGLAFVYAIAALIGWAMGSRLGFGVPLTEAWLRGERPDARGLARAAILGAVLALGAVATVLMIAGPQAPPGVAAEASVMPAWGGLALALHGGVGEELIFRFGVMALFAWVIAQLRRLVHSWEAPPNQSMIAWGGIVIAALLFGLAHGWDGSGAILVQISFRIAAGILFGWLFWKRGLEAAMAAHLAYDLVVFYLILALV